MSVIIRGLLIWVVLYDPLFFMEQDPLLRAYIRGKEAVCRSRGEKHKVCKWKNPVALLEVKREQRYSGGIPAVSSGGKAVRLVLRDAAKGCLEDGAR